MTILILDPCAEDRTRIREVLVGFEASFVEIDPTQPMPDEVFSSARLVLLVPVFVLSAWGLLRSYLSLLTMFGHRAVERTPREAAAILRDNWRDAQVVAPGLALLHYFLVLLIPLTLGCWLAASGALWASRNARTRGMGGDSPS